MNNKFSSLPCIGKGFQLDVIISSPITLQPNDYVTFTHEKQNNCTFRCGDKFAKFRENDTAVRTKLDGLWVCDFEVAVAPAATTFFTITNGEGNDYQSSFEFDVAMFANIYQDETSGVLRVQYTGTVPLTITPNANKTNVPVATFRAIYMGRTGV